MANSRGLPTRLLLALLAVPACTGGPVGLDTSSPAYMSADPQSVSVEINKTADVDIRYFNVNHQALSTSTWLPLSTLQNSDPSVATASFVNGRLRIFGLTAGTTNVTVTSSASVHTTITVTVTSPTPVITDIVSSTTKGTPGFIWITATDLTDGAKVLVNGEVRTAERVSPTQLRVTYTKEETYDLTPGPLNVAVFNGPDGAQSNVRVLQVVYPEPPAPTFSQDGVLQGYDQDLVLTVYTNDPTSDDYSAFSTSKVRVDGVEFPTTFLDRNKLQITLPKAMLASAGTHQITVVNPAPGGGTSDPSVFTVEPVAGAPTATFDFRNYEGVVNWVATAMGNAPFTQAQVVNGVLQFPVTAPKASVAIVTSTGNPSALRSGTTPANVVTYFLTILSMTREEMTAAPNLMAFPRGTTPLSGTVSGLGAGEIGQLLWGNSEAFTTAAQPTFSVSNSTTGPHRLVGYRRGGGGPSIADRVFVRASQASAAGISVDFTGAESAPVASATASLAGLIAGDQAFGTMGYITEPTCEGTLWYSTPASASFLITGIPAGLQGTSDVHLFRTLVINGNQTLQQTFYTKALIGFAAARPTPAAVPTVSTVTTTPYLIRQAQVNLGNYEAGSFFYSTVSITATKGFLGGATGTIRGPDLSAVAGWNPAWAPPASPFWTFGANSYANVLQPCTDGSSATTVSVSGSTP